MTNFKHLKGVSTFPLSLEEKTASDKVLKEIIGAIFSVVGLVYLSAKLQIVISRFRTCKCFHNILRLFNVLPNFALITSETMGGCYL